MKENTLISRRELLTKGLKTGAALGFGAIAAGAFGNFGSSFSEMFEPKALAAIPTGALDFAATEPCVLTCAATLGPCYYNANLVRRDITEGKAGLPTRLGFRVVNADTCEPIPNASIDIWHTDSQGIYSAPISTFCNGTDSTVQNDYDGDGKTDIAVWRETDGTFYILKSTDGTVSAQQWGLTSDSPIAVYDAH